MKRKPTEKERIQLHADLETLHEDAVELEQRLSSFFPVRSVCMRAIRNICRRILIVIIEVRDGNVKSVVSTSIVSAKRSSGCDDKL